MGFSEIVNDVKTHLEQGAELAASHVAPLLDLAGKIESDPLVQAAANIVVPASSRGMLADFLRAYEADAHATAAAAAEPAPQA